MFADNSMALKLAETGKQTPKSKRIDVCYHLSKDYVSNQAIKFTRMPGTKIPADGLTQPLDQIKFKTFVEQIGLKTLTSEGEC